MSAVANRICQQIKTFLGGECESTSGRYWSNIKLLMSSGRLKASIRVGTTASTLIFVNCCPVFFFVKGCSVFCNFCQLSVFSSLFVNCRSVLKNISPAHQRAGEWGGCRWSQRMWPCSPGCPALKIGKRCISTPPLEIFWKFIHFDSHRLPLPAIPSFQVSTGWERRSSASCPAVSLALLLLGLKLRSRTRPATSRFSRLAWWARKATTSINLTTERMACWTPTYCLQYCPEGCDSRARKQSQQWVLGVGGI